MESGFVATTETNSGAASFVGQVLDGSTLTITDCNNSADISSAGFFAGGLVANVEGDTAGIVMERCSNKYGTITAENRAAGGLLGYMGGNSLRIIDSYSTGSVTADARTGGVLGSIEEDVTGSFLIANCYSMGAITSTSTNDGHGIVGRSGTNDLTVSNCYYSSTTTPTTNGAKDDGAIAKTSDEFGSGEVAWLLNAANTEGVLDVNASADRALWNQYLVRTPSTGEFQGGEPNPVLDESDRTGKLVRAAFMIPAPFDNTYAYANEGTRIALPRGYTAYHLNSSTGTTITNPYAIAAGTGDFSVYMEGIGTWEAVGAGQDEATLRTTAVVGSNNGYALSGSGSEADPYVISTPEALAWYAYKVNQHSRTNIVNSDGTLLGFTYDYAYVQLGADIDLEGKPYGGLADESKATAADKYANVLKWIPIDQYYPRFDGKGHTVDHLT